MIWSLAKPFLNSTGDIRIVTDLNLSNKLVKLIGKLPTKNLLYLYSNSMYVNGWGIIGAFKSKLIDYIIKDLEQKVFNREMVVLHIAVEYSFGLITKY